MKRILLAALFLAGASQFTNTGFSQQLEPIHFCDCGQDSRGCDASSCSSCAKSQASGTAHTFGEDALNGLIKLSASLLSGNIDKPLKFSTNTPNLESASPRFVLALCGHVCDTEGCNEQVTAQPVGQSIATAAKDATLPMPMLQLTRVAADGEAASDNGTITLAAPLASPVRSLEQENVELRIKVAVLERELELRLQHETEVRQLMAANSELAIDNAELSATQEATASILSLVAEKSQLVTELHAAQDWIRSNLPQSGETTYVAAPAATAFSHLVTGICNDICNSDCAKVFADQSNGKGAPVPFAISTSVPVTDAVPAKTTSAVTTAAPSTCDANCATCNSDKSTCCEACTAKGACTCDSTTK